MHGNLINGRAQSVPGRYGCERRREGEQWPVNLVGVLLDRWHSDVIYSVGSIGRAVPLIKKAIFVALRL